MESLPAGFISTQNGTPTRHTNLVLDQFLFAINNPEESVGVKDPNVPCLEPTVRRDAILRRSLVAQVSLFEPLIASTITPVQMAHLHNVRPMHPQLASLPWKSIDISVVVNNKPSLDVAHEDTDTTDFAVSTFDWKNVSRWRCLGQTITCGCINTRVTTDNERYQALDDVEGRVFVLTQTQETISDLPEVRHCVS